jgi:hypothetical protein
MIYRVLRIMMRRHAGSHLLVPLLVGLIVEMIVVYLNGNFHGWTDFVREKLSLILGVVITYLVIAGYIIYRETSNQIERSQLEDLADTLATAQSFFATCAISLKEWFDPSTQVYFARIVSQKLLDSEFRQERVLLFFTEGELKNSKSLYLDGHYAKALIAIHENHGIDLAFIGRKDIYDLLNNLTIEEKKILKIFPRWIAWCPETVLTIFLHVRRRIPELDFAFITHKDKTATVLPFSPSGESLKIEPYESKESIQIYEKLVCLIRERIYVPNEEPPRLRNKYNFAKKIEEL